MQRNLTLLLTLALTLSLANADPNVAAHHRILRKRQRDDPEPSGLLPLIGAGADPETPVASSTAPASSTISASQASVTSSATSSSSSALPSISNILSSSSSVVSSSSSSSSAILSSIPTVSTSSEIVPSVTSDVPPPAANTPTEAAVVTNTVKGVTFVTTTGAEAQNTAPPEVSGATAKPSTIAITVLVAIAASIGGIVILWTIFRKWQSSRKVDSRMQPIDWQPGSFDNDMDGAGIPGEHRRHSGSSFRSSNHGSDEGHSSSHGHGARTLGSMPAHDFTATNGNLAPVGGYADLSRGPSLHQPQMAEMQGGVTPLHFKY